MDFVQQLAHAGHKAGGLQGDAKLLPLLAWPVPARGHACSLRHIARPNLYPHWHPLPNHLLSEEEKEEGRTSQIISQPSRLIR